MKTVRITRNTSADNKSVFEGDVLEVSDQTANQLVIWDAAELSDSETVEDKPKRGRKPNPKPDGE